MTPTQEFEFWGRQATEHALFMHLGLEDPALKKQALDIHNGLKSWYDTLQLDPFLKNLETSMAFKRAVLARLNAGEWLGWLYPDFVDHVLREEEYFLAKLSQGVGGGRGMPANIETATWLRFMGEHAQFAAQLVDPTEAQAMSRAAALARRFEGLHAGCTHSTCGPQMVALSERAGRELDAFFSGMKPAKPKSIIHPVLAAHVVREGRRFVETMRGMLAGVPNR